ncbi:SOSS complex subunit B [Glycine max]|nr:SOSS complex subunit B [Glycine max]
MILLKDIVPAAQNNIDTKFIILDKGKTTVEGQNKICLALVADATAAIHFQFWGDECDAFDSGDIICLTNGIFSYQHGNLILRAGKRGKLVKVGGFTMAFVETPNMKIIYNFYAGYRILLSVWYKRNLGGGDGVIVQGMKSL